MTKQQITNLTGAATIVALVVAIGLLLGGVNRPTATAQSEPAPVTQPVVVDDLQAENAALQEMVTTYQAREAEYAAQIELANELLAAPAAAPAAYTDDDAYEHEHEEHEEHEHAYGEVEYDD
jgi:ribosomal protein S7